MASIHMAKEPDLLARLQIASIDTPDVIVTAHYNPKEIQIDRSVPWQTHDSRDNRAWYKREDLPQHDLEYTGAEPRTMSIELLFDGYEANRSVEPIVDRLDELASIRDLDSLEEAKRAPRVCMVTWGTGQRPFRCVIESLSVKYTMFSRSGMPLRATCTLKLKEAVRVVPAKKRA